MLQCYILRCTLYFFSRILKHSGYEIRHQSRALIKLPATGVTTAAVAGNQGYKNLHFVTGY